MESTSHMYVRMYACEGPLYSAYLVEVRMYVRTYL